jgi:hypothetical protein
MGRQSQLDNQQELSKILDTARVVNFLSMGFNDDADRTTP